MGRFFNTVTAQKHFRPGRLQYCQQTVNGSTKPIHIQLPHHCTKKEVKKVRSDPFPVNSQKLNHNEFGAPIHMSYYCSCYFDENNHIIKCVAWNFDDLTDDCHKVPKIVVYIKSILVLTNVKFIIKLSMLEDIYSNAVCWCHLKKSLDLIDKMCIKIECKTLTSVTYYNMSI